jgi:hypothetical protein
MMCRFVNPWGRVRLRGRIAITLLVLGSLAAAGQASADDLPAEIAAAGEERPAGDHRRDGDATGGADHRRDGDATVGAFDPGFLEPPADSRRQLDTYFSAQTRKLTDRTLAGIQTAEDWNATRGEYRRQLAEMLGLDPMPPRTPLEPVVTGVVEDHGVVVEKLHFQSMPGLYVTANLYRPVTVEKPLPTILYVCGHARAVEDGVSLGGKTSYHHHGVWFARNGYVCLVIDTIQLGEIEGTHHGTYRYGMWWWNNRGYTPAGVEAWNGIRALDYLETRPEVDAKRFGITGRSGGGAYSWWVAALDDRIAAAVPVAGITSLQNYVVDGCVDGHCDCMFMVNTYRWDFPLVAALIAPRPLLISNTDKDSLFPLEGVVDVHARTRRIYRLLGADDRLGLQITEGPHKDTQELHTHAFRWFNRFLRDTDELISIPAEKVFPPKTLQVFEQLPSDERVTTIHDSFVAAKDPRDWPESSSALEAERAKVTAELAAKTFGGWPTADETVSLEAATDFTFIVDGVRVRGFHFNSEPGVRLPLYVLDVPGEKSADKLPTIELEVLNQADWEAVAAGLREAASRAGEPVAKEDAAAPQPADSPWQQLIGRDRPAADRTVAYFPPRGIGPTAWGGDERTRTQIRRRFMLLGQTEGGMRVWDIRRAIGSLGEIEGLADSDLRLRAGGDAAVLSLHASLFEPQVKALTLNPLPAENRLGPDLLNVSRFVELPTLALLVAGQGKRLEIDGDAAAVQPWAEVARAHREMQVSGELRVAP